ncbi:MAG: MvdC/MvdD family ATP grasp protein, partial [Acidimicrobiales bacterium]
MIVVVSHEQDDHAHAVLGALARRGRRAELVDTAAYPTALAISQRFGPAGSSSTARTATGGVIDLDRVGALWWRRPQPYTLHDELDPGVAAFTYSECSEAVAGLWASLDAKWVNPPALDETAAHKPYQLKVATDLGILLPRTLITNDPAAARAFAGEMGAGRTIYKTFLATEEHWRETRVL